MRCVYLYIYVSQYVYIWCVYLYIYVSQYVHIWCVYLYIWGVCICIYEVCVFVYMRCVYLYIWGVYICIRMYLNMCMCTWALVQSSTISDSYIYAHVYIQMSDSYIYAHVYIHIYTNIRAWRNMILVQQSSPLNRVTQLMHTWVRVRMCSDPYLYHKKQCT